MADEMKLKEPKDSKLSTVIAVITVLVGLVAVGAVGQFAGAGWFGYRQILYGVGEVYLLNMGEEQLMVSVDGAEPVEVSPRGARLVSLMGGETQIVARDTSGERFDTFRIFTDESDALVKLSKDGCLAVSDVGAFYGRGGDGLEIIETIERDAQVYVPGSHNIIWPRETFPQTLASDGGRGLWVELVGCALLDEPRFMRGYLDVRLGERLAEASGEEKK